MKEEFLHFIWKYQLLDISKIKTTHAKSLQIIFNGQHNHLAGPDFLNSKVEIDNQLWVGNVEIHIKSSDWYMHQHEKDSNYNAVVLHVVWEHDTEVYGKDNLPIPTLELRNFVHDSLMQRYQQLQHSHQRWIPCQEQISTVDIFYRSQWLQRLFIERLEKKSNEIFELLNQSNQDWEAVLFQLLAKNFGLKVNATAFQIWSLTIPFGVVRKCQNDDVKISSLFFGQAAFLNESIQDSFYLSLQKEYEYLKHKFKLKPVNEKTFQFFGMRPMNFPTIRLAQLAALYFRRKQLFSEVIDIKNSKKAYDLFKTELDEYWLTHYTFSKESPKKRKTLSRSFIDLIVINTIVPLQFAYFRAQNKSYNNSFDLLREIKAEKNSIIHKFAEIGVESKNAFDTQSLLELKNHYCSKKRCLQCRIGLELLKRK